MDLTKRSMNGSQYAGKMRGLSRQVENTTESTSHLQNVREVFSAVTSLQIPEANHNPTMSRGSHSWMTHVAMIPMSDRALHVLHHANFGRQKQEFFNLSGIYFTIIECHPHIGLILCQAAQTMVDAQRV